MPDQQHAPACAPGAAMKRTGPFRIWVIVGLVVAAIDQFVKLIVVSRFEYGERVPVIPGFFDLTLWYNTGAAFSFLAHHDGWQRWFFIVIAVVATIVIFLLLRSHWQHTMFAAGLALILGGALGNLMDRIRLGKVVDFLLFYQPGSWTFPAFNLADSALTLGAVLLILDEIRRMRAPKENAVDQ